MDDATRVGSRTGLYEVCTPKVILNDQCDSLRLSDDEYDSVRHGLLILDFWRKPISWYNQNGGSRQGFNAASLLGRLPPATRQ